MLAVLSVIARLAALFICFKGLAAQIGPTGWTVTPFDAPSLPLAVRSPYLNIWLPQGNKPLSLPGLWPRLWDINAFIGWYASAVVDGQGYRLMGTAPVAYVGAANQTAVEYTATRTSFILSAGAMQINMSFISPIEPSDLVNLSLPFSYLSISATSTDGNPHSLRLYSDISGELIGGDQNQIVQWGSEDDGQHIVLNMQLQTQMKYSEVFNHAADATLYFSCTKIEGTTTSWAIARDQVNRGNAANASMTLGDKADENFRAVNDKWPVMGISVDWKSVQSTQDLAVWAIGLVRSPSIQYRTGSGTTEDRFPYFVSTYNDGATAAKAFLEDFSRAKGAAAALDTQLNTYSLQFSEDYANLLALTARQALGSMDITIAKSYSGDWNTSNVKIFMKNTGGIGTDADRDTYSVNTVDTLYTAFPIFLYLNPELGKYLLTPLLEYQESAEYGLTYAARNIGSTFPNATADGLNDDHEYGVEESANMVIMTLAYSQRSGNGTLIAKHYGLLREWAEYLVSNTLVPTNQNSADFGADSSVLPSNQTNLALKGIIGIASMAKIAEAAGYSDDQNKYKETAVQYISQWQSSAVPSDNSRVNFFYNNVGSGGLIYNLYADKLLQLNLVPSSVYDAATTYYKDSIDEAKYGLPLDASETDRTTANWMMFAASTVTDPSTRNQMISQIREYAASNYNNTPFPTIYNPTTGTVFDASHSGLNSPASGGLFSLLALNTSIKPIDASGDGSSSGGGINPGGGSDGDVGSDGESSFGVGQRSPDIRTLAGDIIAGLVVSATILLVV